MLIEYAGRKPVVDAPSVWIAPQAIIVGSVRLAPEVSVWFGSVLRGDNEPIDVGARSNIQEHCVLHTDPAYPLTISQECTVGHAAVLHGCWIGAQSLIGIGAIVLNGARIGRHCLIGAGTLVPEGMEVPDRSLVVGVPGRIHREVTGAEVAWIAETAGRYVQRAAICRAAIEATDGGRGSTWPPPGPAP
ncbi:MAG: gamma carbonic anhydrase family protein [Planctomycetaceae bacterium]|jgi:carbonic anhydrase/acetyltransferase-like protein (isoleucine patch superfamily)|nr:gamma carbonic anhydrase family protein [Planctomycetaceae bacterium]